MPHKLFGAMIPLCSRSRSSGGRSAGESSARIYRPPAITRRRESIFSTLSRLEQRQAPLGTPNLAIFTPSADYDIRRVVNTGRNYWTLNPEFAMTYLDPCTGLDISGALGYSFNFEDGATQYTFRAGRAFTRLRDWEDAQERHEARHRGLCVGADHARQRAWSALRRFQVERLWHRARAVEWKAGRFSQLMFRYYREFRADSDSAGTTQAASCCTERRSDVRVQT